jgi:hypothetical protein
MEMFGISRNSASQETLTKSAKCQFLFSQESLTKIFTNTLFFSTELSRGHGIDIQAIKENNHSLSPSINYYYTHNLRCIH